MTNTWEPDRNVLSLKGKKVGTTNISSYDYTVNAIGERTNVSQTGTAFGSARDITWGYDSLGQVTSADSTIPGLLAVAIHDQQSSIFYPLFDGNGNVSEYLDSAGAVQGHYEYDPLGGITVATGAKSADFSPTDSAPSRWIPRQVSITKDTSTLTMAPTWDQSTWLGVYVDHSETLDDGSTIDVISSNKKINAL